MFSRVQSVVILISGKSLVRELSNESALIFSLVLSLSLGKPLKEVGYKGWMRLAGCCGDFSNGGPSVVIELYWL